MLNRFWLPVLVALGCCTTFATESLRADPLTYEKDVRSIFRAHCFECHGATEEPKGDLDLRFVRFMLKGGESGAAIAPGKPGESYLLQRVQSGEMPPGEKRLSDDQIAILQGWVAAGAKTARPEPKSIGPGLGITPEERSYWAFQPIRRPTVRSFSESARVRTPVDGLLLAAMPGGLSFSPDTDRLTLIKRAYFDLIGLPPSLEDIRRVEEDESAEWYEHLIDQLLDSEHYGERWARHWLDVAGYADSEGYTAKDDERQWAWKYRDYVIRSLNDDKPIDQFIVEQLAGDELAGPREADLRPEQIDLLTATGFLRMAADGTGSGANNAEARNQVIADTIKIVSSALLGMSVACAQCHDHRYDPIPQTDYYAMRAIFEPALDWQQWKTPQQRRISLYTAADREKAAVVESEAKKIAAEKSEKQSKYMAQALEKELQKYAQSLRDQLRMAYKTAGDKRTEEQTALLKKHPSVNISPGVLYQYLPDAAEDLKKYDKRIADTRAKKPKEEFLRALIEPAGHSPQTKLFHRGDHQQPKQVVKPAALTVVCPENELTTFADNNAERPTSGRRLAYAHWLTSGKHPLLTRVLANRIWMHHFGRAIVSTPGDFGRLGVPPTHPELLDWLADEFVQLGWSLKKLHRVIMLSSAYRQSSGPDIEKERIDPGNRFYWRKPLVRLEAETMRDRMLAASGSLDPAMFGPPLAIKEDDTGQVVVDGEQTRRSLYIRARRSQPVAMLQAFDAPVMQTNCECRSSSTVATQSLMLMNGEFILKQASKLADRVRQQSPSLNASQLALLPTLPKPKSSEWQFGYGSFDAQHQRTAKFTLLPHWTGASWQGGPELPDSQLGWAILRPDGGHPGNNDAFAAIRRWIAPERGKVSVTGTLKHPSEKGDGVRGRIVSNRKGLTGEWNVVHGQKETKAMQIEVEQGDTIDLITDCLDNTSFDSFYWKVELSLDGDNGEVTKWDSAKGFHGPAPSYRNIPAQAALAWELALCRKASADELRMAVEFLSEQLNYLHEHSDKLPKDAVADQQAITNLCQVLLSSNEFLYID